MPSFILLEYLCPTCGQRIESLETRAAPSTQIPHCDTLAPRVPSAVHGRVKAGEVVSGTSDERPPGVLNTEPLADGQPYSEWRKDIKKSRPDEVRKGMVEPQVYV
jgi:hypothetical protein